MHVSLTSWVYLSVALSSKLAFAASFRGGQGSQSVGSAYFITNDPSGNNLLSIDIASDGRLSGLHSVTAAGRGAHGINNPVGPDGLFSQGAVAVNAATNVLVTVNPGSNTISMFRINPNSPSKLTMVGTPVSSEGEFPMSIAVNEKGTMACVLNGGAVNGVNCYTPDPKLGLIAKPNTLRSLNLNQTTPATGPAGAASNIIFSADGSKVIASVKGVPPTPGFLATWDIASDGSLSPEPVKSTPASGGLLPFSMTVIPGTNAILATDAGIGFEVFDFGTSGSNASSTVIPIPGQMATCWSSFSPKSGNFYLNDIGTATITEVNVDKNLKGSIVKQYPQTPGSATIDSAVAEIGSNSFLYVLAANATSVDVLSVNTPGKATLLQKYNFASEARAAGINIDKNNLQGMATFIRK